MYGPSNRMCRNKVQYGMLTSYTQYTVLLHTTSYRSIFPSLELETKDLVGSGLILRFIALPFTLAASRDHRSTFWDHPM